MVPSDYRLDVVTARLIERLEGTRRTYTGRPDDAREHFEEVADQHVRAALTELEAMALDDPGPQGAFLRREIRHTALPRYHRLAVGQNEAEAGGHGFGWLASAQGTVALGVAALFVAMVLVRFAGMPWVWPLILANLSVPFWPSLAAGLARRRYQREVQEIVYDMGRIQEAERAYLRGHVPHAHRAREAPRAEP